MTILTRVVVGHQLQAISYKDAFDDEVDTCDDEGQGHVAVSVQQSDDTDEPGR